MSSGAALVTVILPVPIQSIAPGRFSNRRIRAGRGERRPWVGLSLNSAVATSWRCFLPGVQFSGRGVTVCSGMRRREAWPLENEVECSGSHPCVLAGGEGKGGGFVFPGTLIRARSKGRRTQLISNTDFIWGAMYVEWGPVRSTPIEASEGQIFSKLTKAAIKKLIVNTGMNRRGHRCVTISSR